MITDAKWIRCDAVGGVIVLLKRMVGGLPKVLNSVEQSAVEVKNH